MDIMKDNSADNVVMVAPLALRVPERNVVLDLFLVNLPAPFPESGYHIQSRCGE